MYVNFRRNRNFGELLIYRPAHIYSIKILKIVTELLFYDKNLQIIDNAQTIFTS